MANLFEPAFEERPEVAGFSGVRRARVGREAGGVRLGASVWEVPPGSAAYPLHYHLAEEELLIVLSGRPTLRGRHGERALEEGEVVSFPAGEEGAHQLLNSTSEPVRFASFSTVPDFEICVYPDSNKLGVFDERASVPEDSSMPLGGRAIFRLADGVDYWQDEGRT
jgi:uncharacterized cupin superfamily protein